MLVNSNSNTMKFNNFQLFGSKSGYAKHTFQNKPEWLNYFLHRFARQFIEAWPRRIVVGAFLIIGRIFYRLILIGVACARYYENTWSCQLGGDLVRAYLIGEAVMLSIVTLLILIIIRHSAKGAIMDTHARRYVEPLLIIKWAIIINERHINQLSRPITSAKCSYAKIRPLLLATFIALGLNRELFSHKV